MTYTQILTGEFGRYLKGRNISSKKREIFGINFREKSNIRYFARIIFCALIKRDKWKIQGEKIDVRLC